MKRQPGFGILALVLSSALTFACQEKDSDNDELEKQKDAVVEAPTADPISVPLTEPVVEPLTEPEVEALAQPASSAPESSGALSQILKNSITPYAGIWLLDPGPDFAFENCQFMVRFDAESGDIFRVTLCADGKMQAEVQTVIGFSAKNNAGWSGTMGFSIDSSAVFSSCGSTESYLKTGYTYDFDHSVGTATAANEASLFMTSPFGGELKNFQSGSAIPDLGKNKSCAAIVSRSKLPSQQTNTLLQSAAKVCGLTRETTGNGCFPSKDTFIPTP